jgi:hypothetical protein
MNRTLKYALGAVLTTAVVLPAFAQDQFPDVPDNHWAYQALQQMKKDGLLVGYPDGLFRGPRPASRYELAVAVHATYERLKQLTDGLDTQIKALSANLDGKTDKTDLQALRDALTSLQNDVNGMKPWGDDIANLKKLTDTFEKEIASLGVDVEAMKKDLGDLKDRVAALEKKKPAIDIHGTFDLVGLGGYGTSSRYGIDVTGRPEGVGRSSYASDVVGITRDLSIFHEGAFEFTTTNTDGPKAHATLVVGNMLGTASSGEGPFGNQSATLGTGVGYAEGDETAYFQDFEVTFDTSILGQSFNAEVGRTGYKIDPYIFERGNPTPYYTNDRWNDGKWMFDGAILGFKLGPAKLDVFGGRKSDENASGYDGTQIQPMTVGMYGSPFVFANTGGVRPWGTNGGNAALGLPIDQLLGLRINAPFTDKVNLNLAYLWLDSDTVQTLAATSAPYNRVSVYGGDLTIKVKPFEVSGGYAATDLQYNAHNVVSDDNYAYWGQIDYKADKWGLDAGYKDIEPNYSAPGNWGRIGTWWDPTDIKGWYVGGNVDLTNALNLKANGEWYTGINNAFSSEDGLDSSDKIYRYTVDLGYKLNTSWDVDLGWEYVYYDLPSEASVFTGGKPTEQWYNIGLNYGFTSNAKLSVLWQISDYDSKSVIPFEFNSQTKATGGLLTTQLTVKF